MVSGLWMAGSYAHHQSTRYYYPHSTEGKTGVHGGQTEGHLARRWPSQDLNPHQLTPETVLITIEPLGLTVCLSSQALIFLVHHVSQCQMPAWRKEYIFRESVFANQSTHWNLFLTLNQYSWCSHGYLQSCTQSGEKQGHLKCMFPTDVRKGDALPSHFNSQT